MTRLTEILKPSDNDFLAEIVISKLIRSDEYKIKDIILHPSGTFKRYFRKDIIDYSIKKQKGREEIHLFISREGLYDTLPEGLFHTSNRELFKKKSESKAEIRLHRMEETNARKFFLPLEQEFYRQRVQKELGEQHFFHDPSKIDLFLDFFNLNHSYFSPLQKISLFYLLPFLTEVINDANRVETFFEIILQEKVTLELDNKATEITEIQSTALGESTLGKDLICGSSFVDENPVVKMTIGPLNKSESVIDYLFGEAKKVIERLISLLLQADLESKITVLLQDKDQDFMLDDNLISSRLNYSTRI